MSNGFPMAAIVGKHDVMNAAQDTFISSTYWTDRIGPAASLVTIRKMQENNVPAHLSRIGSLINAGWDKLAKEHNLKINIEGILPLTHFSFDYKDSLTLHTLFTQEMLKRGYLASKAVYVSYCHSEECVETYLENVSEVFEIIKQALVQNNASDLLEGPTANTGFKRLN